MATLSLDLSVSQLIEAVEKLGAVERRKILNTLYEMEEERAIDKVLKESITDADSGRVYSHESVMEEVRTKYGL